MLGLLSFAFATLAEIPKNSLYFPCIFPVFSLSRNISPVWILLRAQGWEQRPPATPFNHVTIFIQYSYYIIHIILNIKTRFSPRIWHAKFKFPVFSLNLTCQIQIPCIFPELTPKYQIPCIFPYREKISVIFPVPWKPWQVMSGTFYFPIFYKKCQKSAHGLKFLIPEVWELSPVSKLTK